MCKAPSFTRLSSSALLPCYLSWTEFFPARTSFCRNLIFWKTKLPLSKCKKVTPLIKSKKQNSFYRIRWHSPLPWRRTENAVQSGANHLIRQVILPCECYLSVMLYLKRSFVDYNIIKNSPFDPSIRLPPKVKKTPFEHQQNSHPTYI